MADEKVGNKTNKTTQVGRDVYKTSDGEMVSEKSTTFQYKGKWINVPTIHNGYQYDDDTLRMLLNEGIIEPTSIHEDEPSASKAARERSDNLKFSKGGTPMQRQMELFGDGGLKDEGGMIDEVSGNEVPIGGTREGVRDDIPANISEGEFIFPEDVTRYLGLEKLMQLRQQAKMGLQEMEAMGQMGNSDEATMEDDLPFGMADIMVVSGGGEPMEFADGGFVPTKNYAPGGMGMRQFNSLEELEEFQKQNPSLNLMTEYKRLKALQPQLQPEVGMGVSTTRSLSPEITAPARTNIDFKQLMGEAAIEFKEYRNAEGKSIMVAHIGGVAAFPIPEGYTLYVADDSIGNGDTSTDDIVADANNAAAEKAAAEKALSDEPYNAGYPSTASSESTTIDWENLSTKELLEELDKITGVSATIAKGAMAFLGPFGLAGYALIRNQEKRATKATQARIAKGGLSSSQLSELNKKVESLTTKSFGLLGKVLETVGGALGLTTEDVEETKKKANVVEKSTPVPTPGLTDDDMGLPTTPVPTPGLTDDDMGLPTTAVPAAISTAQQVDPPKTIAQDSYGSPLPGNNVFADASGGFTVPVNTPNATAPSYDMFGKPFNDANDRLGRDNLLSKMSERANAEFNATANVPVAAPVSTQEDFGASVPETRFTAPVTPELEPLENYQAPSKKNLLSERNAGTFFNRLGEKAENFITGTPISEQQAIDLGYSTAQPIQKKSDEQILAEGYDILGDAGKKRVDDGTSMEFYKDLIAERKAAEANTAPVTPAPVGSQQAVDQMFVPPVDPRDVGSQTQQAFPNLTRGFDDGSNIATSSSSVTPTTELTRGFDNGSNIATSPSSVTPTTESPRNYTDTAYNYGTTSLPDTAPTFNEKFASERLAGAETFSYDRDGDGTMENYTTETVEEASPASSNSLYQSFVNLITPGDDKEYKGGRIVNTGSKKTTVKKKDTSAKNAIDDLKNSKGGINANTTDTPILGKVSDNGNWQEVVQPGTNAITRKWVGSDNDNNNSNDNSNEGSLFSGGGADNVGNFGAIGDAFGAIGDALGITNYSDDADTNAYQGGLLTKPRSKKKTKVTTKKRGLAARK